MKRRLRIGFKGVIFFAPNIGVFVVYVAQTQVAQILDAGAKFANLLQLAAPELAAKWVCEDSTK